MTDPQLLQAFLADRSQQAFESLFHRYGNLVYSAARRQVRDPHLAEDITQAVFIVLSHKARALARRRTLAGWLLLTARFAARNALKLQARRSRHEKEAASMLPSTSAPSPDALPDWAPHLDAALAQLSAGERDLLVLHYLQQKTLEDISTTLGISADAARKRIARALARLRDTLAPHDAALSATLLASGLASLPILTAPSGVLPALLPAISAHAASQIAQTLLRQMHLTKILLASSAAATLLLLITTALIVNASRQTAPASPQAASPAASAPAVALAPSPLDTLLELSESWAANASSDYSRLHPPGTPEEQTYAAAVSELLKSQRRLIDAWHANLDPADPGVFPVEALYIRPITDDQLKGTRVHRINDQTADVEVPGLPTYHMILHDGRWKVHIRDTVASHFPINTMQAIEILTEMFNEITALHNRTADRIEAGELRGIATIRGSLVDPRAKIIASYQTRLAALSAQIP